MSTELSGSSGESELAALRAAVTEILADHCTPERLASSEGHTDRALWDLLDRSGFTRVGVTERSGGSGGGIADVAALLSVAGHYAAPVPLAESCLLCGWLIDTAGITHPGGIVTTGPSDVTATAEGGGWRLTGTLLRVPAARDADWVLVPADAPDGPVLAVVPAGDLRAVAGHNLAGEQRDDLIVDVVVGSVATMPVSAPGELRLRGGLSRAILIAGGLERVLHLAVRYASERQQFGRPLSAFQAIQHQLALLAGEAAAARACVDGAVRLADRVGFEAADTVFAIAAAKVRTAQAASVAAAIVHQVHGAIGMTREHPLRFSTTRLWSWRSEWGSEAQWSERLAETACAVGADGLWASMVGAG